MDILSTRELAAALGVSESSIKRWADDGALRASRTAGGHRRIARADVIRFVRETRATVVRPQLLGLAEAGVASADERTGDDAERLFRYLESGAAAHARGLLLQLYLEGLSVAAILDGPVRSALEQGRAPTTAAAGGSAGWRRSAIRPSSRAGSCARSSATSRGWSIRTPTNSVASRRTWRAGSR